VEHLNQLPADTVTLRDLLAIYGINFGEASGHLEDARGLLRRADERKVSGGAIVVLQADEIALCKRNTAGVAQRLSFLEQMRNTGA